MVIFLLFLCVFFCFLNSIIREFPLFTTHWFSLSDGWLLCSLFATGVMLTLTKLIHDRVSLLLSIVFSFPTMHILHPPSDQCIFYEIEHNEFNHSLWTRSETIWANIWPSISLSIQNIIKFVFINGNLFSIC